ncbi:hypothetical protein ACIPSA_17660 [Streptomyces sp. NPDC086549]|uniref:hypothetical protein n=1 Tax=Streptomyces sp. NPDC086549 TaxID=3365752 RepID=UPI00382D2E21
MPTPEVAVVAPLTGALTTAGAVLLAEVDRIRTVAPGAADWHVHHETLGIGDTISASGYTAVVGHADPAVAADALPTYEQAGLACLLPFVPGRNPAVTWAPAEGGLIRMLHDSTLALGATALTVMYTEGEARRAERLVALAHGAGLAVTAEAMPPVDAHLAGAVVPGAVLAVLAPQDRLPPLLRALSRVAGAGEGGGYRAVLVAADCGLTSFATLAVAARGLPVWAVHAELCLVRRARVAVIALADALTRAPALRGPRLAADVRARSAHLLGSGGGVLGESLRVSRLSAVCPVRVAADQDTTGVLPLAQAPLIA